MEDHTHISSLWVRIAKFLNRRVIKTSYAKSAIYFAIALAIFLLFCFLFLYLTKVV